MGQDVYKTEERVCRWSASEHHCVILPEQKAPQIQGPPGTQDPRWARAVAGRLLLAGGGG